MNKIAINALSARGGGGLTYIRNFLKNLPKQLDYQLFIFTLPTDNLDFLQNNKNVKIITIADKNPLHRIFWENTILQFYFIKFKVDIVFCPGGMLPLLLFKKITYITMFRNMIPFDVKELKKYKFGINYLRNKILSYTLLCSMKRADKLIFISEFGKKYIDKITKNSIKNSVVIPHGVPEDFFSKLSSNNNLNYHKLDYILYPSSIDFYKNQIQVVQAYKILTKSLTNVPKLIFVGSENQPYAKDLKSFIKNQELTDDIVVLGSVDYNEMSALYRNARFIIFASRSENCPNILMETMMAGKAILCSRKYPMPEFGKDGVLYIDANNPNDIFEKILFLINNKFFLNDYELKAKKIASNYTTKRCFENTWKFLLN